MLLAPGATCKAREQCEGCKQQTSVHVFTGKYIRIVQRISEFASFLRSALGHRTPNLYQHVPDKCMHSMLWDLTDFMVRCV